MIELERENEPSDQDDEETLPVQNQTLIRDEEEPLPPVQGPITSFNRPDHLDNPEKTAGSGSAPETKRKFNDVSSSNNNG